MKVIKFAILTSFCWMLIGCVANPTRDKLERSEKGEQIVLTKKVSVVARSPVGIRWEYVALPGTYKAERKDAHGVYFFGADRSIVQISELYKNELRLKIGGLYLPNEVTELPHLFYVFETDIHTTDSISRYVDQRNAAALAPPKLPAGVGSTIAGNVLGGAIVNALIENGVGEISMIATTPDSLDCADIRAARRPAQAESMVDVLPTKAEASSKN